MSYNASKHLYLLAVYTKISFSREKETSPPLFSKENTKKRREKKFEASLETNEGSTINFKGHCRRFYSWKLVYTISLSAVEESFLPTRCSLFNSKPGFPIKLFSKMFLIRLLKGSKLNEQERCSFNSKTHFFPPIIVVQN